MSLLSRPSRARSRLLIAIFVGLFVVVRLAFLRADAPLGLLHGWTTRELVVEPIAKASEARTWAIFGTFTPNPADNYGFWRPQSPVWVYPLAGWFRIFGASYASLRVFATLVCAMGFAAWLSMIGRRLGPLAVVAAGVFVAFDHVGILYERSGLLEPIVTSFLLVSFDALDRARDRVLWLVPACLFAAAAFLVKQAAVVAVPGLALMGIWALVEARGAPFDSRRGKLVVRAAVIAWALALGGFLLWWTHRPEYQRTLAWNYGNVMLGKHGVTDIDLHGLDETGIVADGATLLRRLAVAARAFPLTGPLALVEVGRIVRSLVARKPIERSRLFFAVYLVTSIAMLLFVKPTTVRYLLVLSPAFAFLTAALLVDVDAWARESASSAARRVRHVPAGLVAAFFLFHAGCYAVFAYQRTYHFVDTAAAVRSTIGDRRDAVVIGMWSAPIVFETPYQHYYVKEGFNDTKAALDALHPTHLLLLDDADATKHVLATTDPALFDGRIEIRRFDDLHHHTIRLFTVGQRPQQPRSRVHVPRR